MTYDWAMKKLKATERAEPWHDERYARTLELLDKRGRLFTGAQVLDLGGPSPMTQLLQEKTGRAPDYLPRDLDLRSFNPVGNYLDAYDLVLCTEVIEHIHDLLTTDVDGRAMWTGSGQRHVLAAALRCLKEDGELFVTTPNAAALKVAYNVLKGWMPRTYDPHVRELVMRELHDLVVAAGGTVLESGEWEVWAGLGITYDQRMKMVRAAKTLGEDVRDRGDDLYLSASRTRG